MLEVISSCDYEPKSMKMEHRQRKCANLIKIIIDMKKIGLLQLLDFSYRANPVFWVILVAQKQMCCSFSIRYRTMLKAFDRKIDNQLYF